MASTARAHNGRAAGLVDKEIVVELARRRGEPGWLAEQRLAAWEGFERAPAPRWQRGIKGWWITDLTAVRMERLRPLTEVGAAVAPENAPTGELRFADAALATSAFPAEWREQGVYFGDLAGAVREHPDLLEPYLGRLASYEDDKFASLAAALWGNGVFLHVPAGVALAAPLRVVLELAADAAFLGWRTVIVAERGSSVSLWEDRYSSDAAAGSLFSALLEIYVGENASVAYSASEEWQRGVPAMGRAQARVESNGRLHWFSAQLGGETARATAQVSLAGPGASLDMAGLFYGEARQHLDLTSSVEHEAPRTTASVVWRGVVKDAAHAAFAGTLRVPAQAQGTESHLTSHTLTLSDEARVDVVPSLEIAANDVQVGHGAAAGKLDEEQVFYLMSRGLPRAQAVRLLVRGFFEPALSRLTRPDARERIERAIEGKTER
ncbi:MAG: Fe-S cluster assembly protein SufD [Chloroflexota bacterium]